MVETKHDKRGTALVTTTPERRELETSTGNAGIEELSAAGGTYTADRGTWSPPDIAALRSGTQRTRDITEEVQISNASHAAHHTHDVSGTTTEPGLLGSLKSGLEEFLRQGIGRALGFQPFRDAHNAWKSEDSLWKKIPEMLGAFAGSSFSQIAIMGGSLLAGAIWGGGALAATLGVPGIVGVGLGLAAGFALGTLASWAFSSFTQNASSAPVSIVQGIGKLFGFGK